MTTWSSKIHLNLKGFAMTATLDTTTATTFEVTTWDAHRWLKASLVCAGTDDTLPMLTHVRLTHVGKTLVLASTDRFRMGFVRIDARGDEGFTFDRLVLDGKDVKQAATILKPANVREREVGVDFTLTDEGLAYKRWDGVQGVIRIADVDFPSIDNLMKLPTDDDEVHGAFEVNTDYLAAFAKVRFDKRDQIQLVGGSIPGRPIRVKVGEHFAGLLMPIRVPDNNHAATWASWSDILS